MFDKGTEIIQSVKSSLETITKANGWNIPINTVIAYSANKFVNLDISELPAIVILANEELEPISNEEYRDELILELYVRFQMPNIDSDVDDIFSKLKSNIFKKLDEDISQGKDYVNQTIVRTIAHPIPTGLENIFEFLLRVSIEFDFDSQEP